VLGVRLRDWAHTISALWETAATLLLIGPPLVTFGQRIIPFGPPLLSEPGTPAKKREKRNLEVFGFLPFHLNSHENGWFWGYGTEFWGPGVV